MATPTPIYRYPLDGTGVSPDNLVVGEEHQLSNRTVRCVAPTYGGFFAESVVVTDAATNVALVRGVDYTFGELFEFPTGRYGKEIFGLIVITKAGVTKVKINYQALGGDYSYSMVAVIEMIDSLNLGERPVEWGKIIGRPPAFDPASHFHDIGDVYGFEYLVHAVERLRAAYLTGDVASHDELFRYIDNGDEELQEQIEDNHQQVVATLDTHVRDKNNPHGVTAAQTGAFTKTETNTAISNSASTTLASAKTYTDEAETRLTTSIDGAKSRILVVENYQPTYTTGGTASALTVATVTPSLPATLLAGQRLRVKFHASNLPTMGAATLKLNSLPAAPLVEFIAGGELATVIALKADYIADLVYNGTQWVIMNPLPRIIKTGIVVYATIPTVQQEGEDVIYVRGIGPLEWVKTANYTGYRTVRVGDIIHGTTNAPRPYELDLVGGFVSKTTYASLWAWAQDNGHVIPQGSWGASIYRFYDAGNGTFRLPDMRNMFLRMTGWDLDTFATRGLGTAQGTAVLWHGHTGSTSTDGWHQHTTAVYESDDDGKSGLFAADNGGDWTATAAVDGNGNHAHTVYINGAGGNESRPANTAFHPRIHI